MTPTEMRAYFDILQDETQTPSFVDAEKDEFLFDVIYGYINEFLGDGDTPPSLEKNKGATEAISTLIKPSTAIAIPASGILTNALISTATGSADIITPIVIVLSSGEPVHFVRHNDIAKFEDNTYKAGTATAPNYTILDSSYQFYPKVTYAGVLATSLIEPAAIDSLPAYKHREQVAKSMAKTGYVTESQALIMMGQSEGK